MIMKRNLRLNQKKKKKNDLIDNIIFGDIDTNNNKLPQEKKEGES